MEKAEILNMPTNDQVSYWLARLLIAIGSGKFREEVYLMMDFYLQVGYERGLAAAAQNKEVN